MPSTAERLAAALADRYRIERELGAGGMATVYLAADLKHDRKVAIKVLKPELAAVLGAERFVQEIKTTAAMSHPHILPLFDSGTADGFLFYVMPFIEGETIRDRLNRETQFGVEEAVRIAREVADALDYAHRHGVIHRDIKPENILLHDGRAMVMDFGIALAVSAAAGGRMTETGLSLGTPHYMSPEQATAEKEITPRSDVYSLASVLYEMLAGEPPHTAGSAQAVIMKIIAETVAPVTALRKSVPAYVAAALAQALQKLPADRFDGAKLFADALANPSFRSDATSATEIAASRMSRWRTIGVPLGALALGAAAVGAWFIATRPAPPQAMRIAIALPEDQRILSGLLSLSLSADGQSFAYVSTDERILVKESRAVRARTIADDARGTSPILAPDASAVAYVTANPGNLVVTPLSGGEVRTLMRDSVQPSAGAWTSSGWIYFSTVGAIMRTRPDGTRTETLARIDSGAGESRFYGVEPLPGERAMLAWVDRRGQSAVVAIEIGSERRHALGQGAFARYFAPGYLLVVQDDGTATLAGFDRSTLTLTGILTDLPFRVGSRAGRGLTVAAAADGTLMYDAPGDQSGQVVRVTRDGSASVLDPAWRDTVREVRLSPDERQIAYRRITRGVQAIWVRELQTGRATLVHRGSGNAYRPEWSSDGRTLRFIDAAANGVAQVMERGIGSAAPAHVIARSPRGIDEASFSRDGRWMVARIGVAGSRDIAAMRLGIDSVLTPIIATRAEELSPALSADATMLAYVSDETGRREVWIAPFPNVESGRRMVSLAGGTEPAWSPDGNELFFKSGDSLQSVTATAGRSGIELTTPRPLFSIAKYFADFNHSTYSVARGAKTYYMTQEPGGAGERLILERGWLQEFITGAKR